MATLIEDQIHKVFIVREEERCRALEAKTGKPVKACEVAKPWKRVGSHAILQDPEFLQYVTEFDCDLAAPTFQEYCRSRGVLHVAGEPGSRRWEYAKDWTKTRDDFLSDPYFRCAQPHEGKGYEYTPREMETHWRVMCLGRAALQDCWELYRQGVVPKSAAPKPTRKKGARPKPKRKSARSSPRAAQTSLFGGRARQ